MEVLGFIIAAVVSGLIIGVLARLVIPGRQPIGILRTILAGIAGALVGGAIMYAVDKDFAEDHQIIVFAVQVAFAALIVWALAGRASRARLD